MSTLADFWNRAIQSAQDDPLLVGAFIWAGFALGLLFGLAI